jgi:hypothetical protein
VKAARTWIVVHDGMPDHPKIEALSDRGFRALITLWCWCSRQLTDGHVPKKAWEKRTTPAVRRELAGAGLVEQLPGGDVAMHDYLDWQRSAVAVQTASEKKQSAARLGNHNRWHVKEGRVDPACEHCVRPKPDPPPIAGPIADAIGPASHTETSTDNGLTPQRRGEERREGLGREGSSGSEREPSRNAPRPRCPKHAELPPDQRVPACGACKQLRVDAEQQAADQAGRDAEDRAARRAAIKACSHCDDNGMRDFGPVGLARCTHPTLEAVS